MLAAPDNGSSEQLLGKTQRILLEISTLLYFIAKNSALPLVQQYVFHLVDIKHNYTAIKESILSANATQGGHDYLKYLANNVNSEASQIILYLNIAELLPAAIVVLFLGCYSDHVGKRKFLMWLPCLGSALQALGYLLPLYISGADIDHAATKAFLVLGSFLSGLSGNLPAYLSGNACYISDTDTIKRRTLRLAFVECIIGVTFGVANFGRGFWVTATASFMQPLWFILVCSLTAMVIILFFLKEPSGELSYQLSKPIMTGWRNIKGIKHLFSLDSARHKKLWAIFIAFQVYIFVQQGQERTFVLFLQNQPLYWKAVKIGTFFLVLYGLSGIGSYPGVPLLQRVFGDISITMLAIISKAMGSFIMAFAEEDFTVFLSCVVQAFHLMPYATARSVLSQQVGDDEQGSAYALLHSVQAVVGFLGPLVHNIIFTVTMEKMSGLVFLVSGPFLAVPFLLLIYIRYMDRENIGYGNLDDPTNPAKAGTPMDEKTTLASAAAGFGSVNDTTVTLKEEIDEYHSE